MSTALHLAGEDDAARVVGLMERCFAETAPGRPLPDFAAIAGPLLAGSPLGAVWLIGPQRAPLGHVVVGFGWSVRHGGMIARLEQIFIRPSVRGRGIGTEVTHAIALRLRQTGVVAFEVVLPGAMAGVERFCARCGFAREDGSVVMSEAL